MDGFLSGVDLTTSEIIWKHDIGGPLVSSVSFASTGSYMTASPDGTLSSVHQDGTVVPFGLTIDQIVSRSPIVDPSGVVLTGHRSSSVISIDPVSGDQCSGSDRVCVLAGVTHSSIEATRHDLGESETLWFIEHRAVSLNGIRPADTSVWVPAMSIQGPELQSRHTVCDGAGPETLLSQPQFMASLDGSLAVITDDTVLTAVFESPVVAVFIIRSTPGSPMCAAWPAPLPEYVVPNSPVSNHAHFKDCVTRLRMMQRRGESPVALTRHVYLTMPGDTLPVMLTPASTPGIISLATLSPRPSWAFLDGKEVPWGLLKVRPGPEFTGFAGQLDTFPALAGGDDYGPLVRSTPLIAILLIALANIVIGVLVTLVVAQSRANSSTRSDSAPVAPPPVNSPAVGQSVPEPEAEAEHIAEELAAVIRRERLNPTAPDAVLDAIEGVVGGDSRAGLCDFAPYTIGGQLLILPVLIGCGSNGTLVFVGVFQGRLCAVKRLQSHYVSATREIETLIRTDGMPHIVRYHAQLHDGQFVYLALELCSGALADMVEMSQQHSNAVSALPKPVQSCAVQQPPFDGAGLVTDHVKATIYGLLNGLHNLHKIGIVHKDIKPQNILFTRGGEVRLSDLGLAAQLTNQNASFATNAGTVGWQAPEVLSGGRMTKKVDIFSLGLTIFYLLSNGAHPFGPRPHREANILSGTWSMDPIADRTDAPVIRDFLCRLLHVSAGVRPAALPAIFHPLLWNQEKRLAFLMDASDFLEALDYREPLVVEFEKVCRSHRVIPKGGWVGAVDPALTANIGGYRQYRENRSRDLLRVIRNKASHYRDLDDELKGTLGDLPHGYMAYWQSRFPMLLVVSWNYLATRYGDDGKLQRYYFQRKGGRRE
ncbi:Protein kinase domain [Carpediemonas membranifera]|uniref:non-specific serine/threonine protein kinase n=1 Tax=Carpediemonas membranifera TaxID=201153 RepID=A0A8J6BZ57_9EUKA|nr:Protein kinase domain [Carpediemonas membranifera]|eukprot:KAG9395211.1 Protein kinase domain [Carpediemonas membranifera]